MSDQSFREYAKNFSKLRNLLIISVLLGGVILY